MSAIGCRRARALVERAFVHQRLALLQAARAHLQRCAGCRLAYERLFGADAALRVPLQRSAVAGDAPVRREAESTDRAEATDLAAAACARLSPTEQALLLDAVTASLDPEQHQGRPPQLAGGRRSIGSGSGLLVPLALALLVVALGLLRSATWSVPSGASLAARQGGHGHAAALSRLGLRAMCLQSPPGAPTRARPLGDRLDAGTAPCPRSATLGFTVRNETGAPRQLQIVVVTADGRVEAVYPRAPSSDDDPPGANGAIASLDDEQPLDTVLPLRRIPVGTLRIVARFATGSSPGALLRDLTAGRIARAAAGDGEALELSIEVGP